MFEEKFDSKKLQVYLNTSTRGFVLILVNDYKCEREIIDFISSKKHTLMFNLYNTDFRDSIEKIKISPELQSVIYYGLNFYSNDRLRTLLEKINLSRDILSVQNKLVFFIMPRYIGRIIQEDYPNLYSYFILKEEYILNYENVFEYILPDGNYLQTKELKSLLENEFHSSIDELDVRLEFYSQTKAKEKEYQRLKLDYEKYINELIAQDNEENRRYFYSLQLKMGDVCVNQQEYQTAREIYNTIITDGVISAGYQGLYYEVLLHNADSYVKEHRYDVAIEQYENLLCMLVAQQEHEFGWGYSEYVVKIVSRLAIYYAKSEKYEKADLCMKFSSDIAKKYDVKGEYFAILYNQILLLLHTGNVQDNQIRPYFNTLKSAIKNEIQEAMYCMLYGWYRGVIDGHCRHALEYVSTALAICRSVLPENSKRIAECHYVNSILYTLIDEPQKADYCREKSKNIGDEK